MDKVGFFFLLHVDFVYVSSSLYKVNFCFSTEALEHSCLKKKKIPFALFKIRKNMNEVRLCNMLHLMATGQHCTVGSLMIIIMILNVF